MSYIGTNAQDPNYFANEPTSIELEGGTYNTDRLYRSSTATVTGDITLTNNLVLARITDKGNNVTLTSDGTTRTITGSGKIESGNIVTTMPGNFTGMTGTVGSGVTIGSAVNLASATFPAFAKSFFVKGWVTFNQSSNTILSSYNVSSISHPATGRTIINWDTDFGSANYAISGMASDSSNPLIMTLYNASGAITSSSVQIMVQYQNFNLADGTFVSVMAIGD